MTEPNLPEVRLSEAQALIEQLVKSGPDIENLVVAFSHKGRPYAVVVGSTGSSPTMWVLGALDHLRWHIYNSMTMHKYAKEEETAVAMHIVDHLKKEGRLN